MTMTNEDRFFLERDMELRARIRAEMETRARETAEHRKLTEQLAGNEALAKELRDLGFDATTAPMLHLIPLVAVAWADGELNERERTAVIKVAEAHGLKPGEPASNLLASLLERKPSRQLIDQLLKLLNHLLAARDMHPHSLLDACLQVAEASGGFLGFGNRVSAEERAMLETVARTFAGANRPEVFFG
jgi:tellurite resistance protein